MQTTIDNQTVTNVDSAAAAGHTRDGAHHTLGFDDGIHHHQRINRARILDTAEKTGVEIAAFFAVEVVNRMAMGIEHASESISGGLFLARCRRAAADRSPVVGGVVVGIQPEISRQIQRYAVEGGGPAVHQLRHTRQLLRRGDVERCLGSVVPRDVRGTVPNGLRRHRCGSKAERHQCQHQ